MKKETILNDNAGIYQKRQTKKPEKEKWNSMSRAEKWNYFNDYYRNKLIILLLAIAFIIYFLYSVFAPKPETVLNIATINEMMLEDDVTALTDNISNHLKLDPQKQNIYIDTSFHLGSGMDSQLSMASVQKLNAFIATGALDVIISDEETFQQYSDMGSFYSLSELLPPNLYNQFSDSFYITGTSDDPDERAYGLYLTDSPIYSKINHMIDKPIMGILVNSKYTDHALELINYFFELD